MDHSEHVAPPPGAREGEPLFFTDPAAWHAARAQDVTASTIAGHFGFSSWSSRYSDYVEKAGLAPREDKDDERKRAGRHLEAGIAAMAAEEEGWDKLLDAGQYQALLNGVGVHPAAPPSYLYLRDRRARLGATPDRILVLPDGRCRPVEVKNVSWQAFRDEWEDGQAPVKYWLQAQVQVGIARLAGLPWDGPIVVGLVAGNDLRVLPYDFDQAAFDECRRAAATFWDDVAAGREPLADFTRSVDREALRRRFRISTEKTLDLSASDAALQVAQALSEARARERVAKDEADLLSAQLLSMIGDAERAKLPDGWSVLARTQARAAYTVAEGTTRPIRLNKPKVTKETSK